MNVPRVVDNGDVGGPVGGLGTAYLGGKIALLNVIRPEGLSVKLAVAPTLQILGQGALQALAPGRSRTEWGVPVSAEVDSGPARVFGSAGYFSTGVWFAGAGVGGAITPRLAVTTGFSRAWTTDLDPTLVRDRKELSGGAAFSLTRQVSIFGSLGRTIATADNSGAGTTVAVGVSFFFQSTAR